MGRPKLPDEEKKQYRRLAVYPQTHATFVAQADKANMKLVDFMEQVGKTLVVTNSTNISFDHK
jgi:hypothetical protein